MKLRDETHKDGLLAALFRFDAGKRKRAQSNRRVTHPLAIAQVNMLQILRCDVPQSFQYRNVGR